MPTPPLTHLVRWLALAVVLAACAAPGPSRTPTSPPPATTVRPAPTLTHTPLPVSATVTDTASAMPSATAAPPTATPTQTGSAASATPTLTPTQPRPAASVTPQPTATLVDPTSTVIGVAARILSFGASADQINPGEPVTLAWEVAGSAAELCALPPIGRPGPKACTTMPVSGTATLVTSDRQRYWARFSLRAVDFAHPDATFPYAELAVAVTCPDLWLTAGPPFEAGEWNCPIGPARTTTGAAERFEHGGQYWLAEPDEILVYWGAGEQAHVRAVPIGGPERPAEAPPPGLYAPVQGFGLVWRGLTALGDLRAVLGWATEPERQYTFSYQCNAVPDVASAVCLVLGPDGYTTWRGLDWGPVFWP